jgi:hypothetical protein
MFEKEAEEYAEKHTFYDEYSERHRYDKPITEIFKDGANIGYNKAKEEAKDIINELLMNGYCESTRDKALNFLYPDKE